MNLKHRINYLRQKYEVPYKEQRKTAFNTAEAVIAPEIFCFKR